MSEPSPFVRWMASHWRGLNLVGLILSIATLALAAWWWAATWWAEDGWTGQGLPLIVMFLLVATTLLAFVSGACRRRVESYDAGHR